MQEFLSFIGVVYVYCRRCTTACHTDALVQFLGMQNHNSIEGDSKIKNSLVIEK